MVRKLIKINKEENKSEDDIEKILMEKKSLIDSLIEKYIPRVFNKTNIKNFVGREDVDVFSCNEGIAKPIYELLDRGGKRWRPTLFLLIVEALGGDLKKLQDFCIVPELIHNGTLIVDDVEDYSELRRGKPAIHKIFGIDIAINAGNALYFMPLIVFLKNRNKINERILLRAYEVYIEEMINISFGQAIDIVWHKGIKRDQEIKEEEYLTMCALKTGTLARMSARLAATLCGASENLVEKLGRFAESLGIAFQIQDDILDVTSPDSIGKEYGNDIKEGKRTLMVIYTLRRANKKDKERLIEILNKHTDDMEERKEAINILNKYHAIEYAQEVAREIIKKAWNDVEKILPESEAKNKIRAFANYMIERKR
ncbi:MAG: polyprenyl synthetase family protein [Candidatus Aenigmatarchaeota archaeon]|nr:polyprenyl synthetase family protein [Candidatus Aenigmarchaeota archaeon]